MGGPCRESAGITAAGAGRSPGHAEKAVRTVCWRSCVNLRYVVQDGETLRYLLTTRLMSLGLQATRWQRHHRDGPTPAKSSGHGERRTGPSGGRRSGSPAFHRQGTRCRDPGLRYDPDMGGEAALYCSATGFAWLATLPENEAVEHVVKQGFTQPEQRGERCTKNDWRRSRPRRGNPSARPTPGLRKAGRRA